MGPLREIPREKFASLKAENLRSITEAVCSFFFIGA